jgi:hypothetical protein
VSAELTVAVAALVVAAVALLAAYRAGRRANRLQDTLAAVAEALQQVRAERARTAGELDRVDVLLRKADVISSRVESTSKLAYDTFATPVIKAFAVGAGTRTAARRLRRTEGNGH